MRSYPQNEKPLKYEEGAQANRSTSIVISQKRHDPFSNSLKSQQLSTGMKTVRRYSKILRNS
ncbi:hypothetical protein CR513_33071, partial [Mucuna pruriens]